MDVDYNVIENGETQIKHLVIDALGTTKTICGLSISPKRKPGLYGDISMTMRKFWRSQNACKNCKRAAKH